MKACQVTQLELLSVTDPPSLTIHQKTNIAEENVQLVCEVSLTKNSPKVTGIVWTKDTHEIDISGSDGKYSGGNLSEPSLTINSVHANDAGEYQCSAINAVGKMCSEIIQLDRPFIEWTKPDYNKSTNTFTWKPVIKSIPNVLSVQWKVREGRNDDFQPIDVHDKTYQGSLTAFPRPVLVVHGHTDNDSQSFGIEVSNFIGKAFTDEDSDDEGEDQGDSRLPAFFAHKGSTIQFHRLKKKIISEVNEQDLLSLIGSLRDVADLHDSLQNVTTMDKVFDILREEKIADEENVITIQFLMREIGREDLDKMCVDYARKKKRTLCFYKESTPANGNTHVSVYINGNVKSFSRKDIGHLISTVAAIAECDEKCIKVNGLRPHQSFIVILLMKTEIATKLTEENMYNRLKQLSKFKVYKITIGVKEITISPKGKEAKLTESPIPENVREQYAMEVEKWREEDKLYYETHSFPSVMEKVRNEPCVTFVGVPGSGKSATARHIALELQGEGYEVVPTKDVRKIEDYGDRRNPQVFVIDDVVGVFGLQKTKLDVLTDYGQKITQPCMVKSKTLMTCREAVFNETLPDKAFLTKEETVIKLHSSDHALDNDDIKQILQKYGLNVEMLPALLTSTSHMFPLLCKLFSKETKFQALGSKFFQNPVPCIIGELDDMQRENKLNYATLVLCMLNENRLSEDILEDKENENFVKMKKELLKKFRLKHDTDTFVFTDALSAMEGTYTKQCGAQYTFIHDSMFEICAYHYGKQFPDQMLQYMSSSYIANYVKPQTSEPGIVNKVKEKQCESQPIEGRESSDGKEKESDDKNSEREELFDLYIRLREDQYPLLAERLYRDIQNMELYDVFRNQVLKHPQVYQAFIHVLKTKSYTELKDLFLSSQEEVDKITSKEMEMRQEDVLVDQKTKRNDEGKILYLEYMNVRVVNWVIYYGHYQILEYIIQQTVQHNEVNELFGITENSPHPSKSGIYAKMRECLGITGNSPHQSESGISSSNKQESENNRLVEESKLLVLSCYGGDVQTVRVLLSFCNKAINVIGPLAYNFLWCFHTPLTAACEGGHVSIVEELVKAGADVNLQDIDGNTPLITACKGGHVSIVEELVKAGADVNLEDSYGDTPLITACKGGHVSIVEELVKAGADVNLQDGDGNTPLITAVRDCPFSTVKCLVEHGAALVTQVVDINESAVYTALILNKPDIVKYLIQEQNKINPGKFNGNVHLFNCLVDIRHARVKTDSRDDVVLTDRSVWCMDRWGDLWKAIRMRDYDELRHLLCVGLDVNQSMQLYDEDSKSEVRPLLYTLIDVGLLYGNYKMEIVRIPLGAGADFNIRVRDTEYDSMLDREGVSLLERTRRLVCRHSKYPWNTDRMADYKRVMCEIKKHVRRHSV